MASTKYCDNNKMREIDNSASFNLSLTGEDAWMATRSYTIANCELETFYVSQDCENCPIKKLNPLLVF